MDYDVELMRELLFELESRQAAPGATLVIAVDEVAMAIGRPSTDVERGVADLIDLAYIDGTGSPPPGFFPFRNLTRKGILFVRATRSPREWERMKDRFAQRRFEDGR